MKTATRHCVQFFLVIAVVVASVLAWRDWSRPVLRLYVWNDYIYPDVIADFEKRFGVRVDVTNYRSNAEMMARVKVSWNEFDVIMPSSYMVASMRRQGLLLRLPGTGLENRANVDPKFRTEAKDALPAPSPVKFQVAGSVPDAGPVEGVAKAGTSGAAAIARDEDYAIPYLWNYLGIGYSKTEFPDKPPAAAEPPKTWAQFFSREVAAKYGRRRMMVGEPRELIGLALIALGQSPNTRERQSIRDAGQLLQPRELSEQPRLVFEDGGELLAAGEGVLLQSWAPEITRLQEKVPAGAAGDRSWFSTGWDTVTTWLRGLILVAKREPRRPEIGYIMPGDGSVITVDTLAIPASSSQPELAAQFINFLLETEVAKRVTLDSFYANTLFGAEVEKLRGSPSYQQPPNGKTHFLVDVGDAQLFYDGVWAEFTRMNREP
jgi:spermidine/putrescine-binding protein